MTVKLGELAQLPRVPSNISLESRKRLQAYNPLSFFQSATSQESGSWYHLALAQLPVKASDNSQQRRHK